MIRDVVSVRARLRSDDRRPGQGPGTAGHAVLNSGRFIPEEQPAAVIDAVLRFADSRAGA